jgi:hypothetical protein
MLDRLLSYRSDFCALRHPRPLVDPVCVLCFVSAAARPTVGRYMYRFRRVIGTGSTVTSISGKPAFTSFADLITLSNLDLD